MGGYVLFTTPDLSRSATTTGHGWSAIKHDLWASAESPDPTTAKVSAEARWYTPGTGGFVSRDSVGLPLTSGISANRYVYGNANPLAFNDPSGHFSPGDFFREGVRDLKVGARGVGAVATVVEEVAVPVVEVAGEVVAGEVVAGAAVVASAPGWVPIVGAVVVGGALGVAAGYAFDRYGNSQARTSPAPVPAVERSHWVDYDDSNDEWPQDSPATQNDRTIDVKPTLKPRFTSGGRAVQVHPRTQLKPIPLPKPRIPPMPLPQLKQHAPAGPVWSGSPNITPPDGWSVAGKPLELEECAPGVCADSLPSGDGASGQGTDGSCASAGGPSPLATTCLPDEPGPDPAAGGKGRPPGDGKPPAFPDSPANPDDNRERVLSSLSTRSSLEENGGSTPRTTASILVTRRLANGSACEWMTYVSRMMRSAEERGIRKEGEGMTTSFIVKATIS
ncbi:RHS repeat-associated core domain-containing protein [Frankia sp. Cas3]|uniref:RHS repeat-associated core domain-containing protein n=1 Tax=Frankia sp. Cas3 TaxID=3073926 RepID=UPI003A101016